MRDVAELTIEIFHFWSDLKEEKKKNQNEWTKNIFKTTNGKKGMNKNKIGLSLPLCKYKEDKKENVFSMILKSF